LFGHVLIITHALTALLVLCGPEMVRNSCAHVSAKLKRNVGIRVESFRSNDGVDERINVRGRLMHKPYVGVWRQAKAQHNAQLFKQELNLSR